MSMDLFSQPRITLNMSTATLTFSSKKPTYSEFDIGMGIIDSLRIWNFSYGDLNIARNPFRFRNTGISSVLLFMPVNGVIYLSTLFIDEKVAEKSFIIFMSLVSGKRFIRLNDNSKIFGLIGNTFRIYPTIKNRSISGTWFKEQFELGLSYGSLGIDKALFSMSFLYEINFLKAQKKDYFGIKFSITGVSQY